MPTGIVLAYSVPDGASIFMDNIAVFTRFGAARTPALIPQISAGEHNIAFKLSGYTEKLMRIQVQQGGYTTVSAILDLETKHST
jgi:hypothetical protein